MIQLLDKCDCCGCFACFNVCPQQCIEMQNDEEGFWYPVIDIEECNECDLCEQVCPILMKQAADNRKPLAYASMNTNELIREQSSSGGMFTVLAERVLANQGVVFGAGFDDKFNVVHSWTDKVNGLDKFRGSKYVQSRIGETYQEAEDFLNKGRHVLFSGTPCQIAGLKAYLGKDYESLICVDIICHGVPSPKVWQLYKEHLEELYHAKAERIAFRRKNYGWKLYSVSISFKNDTEYSQTLNKDIYMQGFLKNLYLRPSCYACSFKTLNRLSDITLADFWGIQNVLPSFDDDRGTSLTIVNTSKGMDVLADLADKIICEKVDIDEAISYNSSAIKSVAMNPKRDEFFAELDNSEDISVLIDKYTRVSGAKNAYSKVRGLLGKVKRRVMG